MRVIAGTLKGTRLHTPKSKFVRPTSDRVREYIFSCISPNIAGTAVLDLFAGTGAFGIEAASRGAATIVFVDQSPESLTLVRQNLAKVEKNFAVVKKSAELFLKTCRSTFDFIFCDPPYIFHQFNLILQLVLEKNLLHNDGIVIYESSSREPIIQEDGFRIIRQKKMGDTRITFYSIDYENCSLSRNI